MVVGFEVVTAKPCREPIDLQSSEDSITYILTPGDTMEMI